VNPVDPVDIIEVTQKITPTKLACFGSGIGTLGPNDKSPETFQYDKSPIAKLISMQKLEEGKENTSKRLVDKWDKETNVRDLSLKIGLETTRKN
jgi:hypothetical protein